MRGTKVDERNGPGQGYAEDANNISRVLRRLGSRKNGHRRRSRAIHATRAPVLLRTLVKKVLRILTPSAAIYSRAMLRGQIICFLGWTE